MKHLRFFTLMFVFIFTITLVSCKNADDSQQAAPEETPTDTSPWTLEFELNENEQSYSLIRATFVGDQEGNASVPPLEVPAEHEGLPVTKIGYAFAVFDTNIQSVVLPDSIEEIGNQAFERSALKSIQFGNGLKHIGNNSFSGCALAEVILPDTVTTIGSGAFCDCINLQKIKLSNNLQQLGELALGRCDSLISLEITEPKTKYICKNNCLIDTETNTLTLGCQSSIIPQDEELIGIAPYAFRSCKKLKSISFPDTLQFIGAYAFDGCASLESVTVPSSVKSIERGAFCDCEKLKKVTFENNSKMEFLGNQAFGNCQMLSEINVPSTIKRIGENVFYNGYALKGTAYGSATYLGDEQNPYFMLVNTTDEAITSYDVHADTKFILEFAFAACKSLETVTLPEGLLGISGYAFAGCSLKNFKLPSSILYLGSMPFSIAMDGQPVEDPDYGTLRKYDNAYYIGSTQNPYMVLVKAANTSITSCKVHADTVMIYHNAFESCSELSSVQFESNHNLKNIGEYAFAYCKKLSDFIIPNSVTTVDDLAFSECENLTVCEKGVLYVGKWAIGIEQSSSEIDQLIIRDGTVGISSNLHLNIKTAVLPSSLQYIGESSFRNGANKIYYKGCCQHEFDRIQIGFGNAMAMCAEIYYYSEEAVRHWHELNGAPVIWN